jgi:RND family efflux transporter MFP subunit
MTVRSPIDGQISQVLVTAGQFIGDRSELATVITNTRTIEARVSEENFADIRLDQPAVVTFLTYGDRRFDASVAKILPTADSATQRYVIQLAMPDTPVGLLKPGITGEASILTGSRDNALVIPRRAMVGDSVFVVADGRIELRRIKQGFVSLSDIEVLEGLAEGDQVVVEEIDTFRDGDRVKPVLLP